MSERIRRLTRDEVIERFFVEAADDLTAWLNTTLDYPSLKGVDDGLIARMKFLVHQCDGETVEIEDDRGDDRDPHEDLGVGA